MYATGAEITGIINATGGNFTGTITVGGTIRGGTSIGSSMFAKTLDIGGYDANSDPTAGSGNFPFIPFTLIDILEVSCDCKSDQESDPTKLNLLDRISSFSLSI